MSVTEQQVGHGRSGPDGTGGRARHALTPSPAVRRRPLVAAGLVLLLWFAWLLVPSPGEDDAVDGSPAADAQQAGPGTVGEDGAAEPAEPGGIEAQLFGDDAAAPAPPSAAPSAEATRADGEPAPSAPGSAPPAASPEASAPAAPEPVEVPQAGAGTFAVAPGGTERVGSQGTLVRYTVEVEDGLPLDAVEVAGVVDGVLADPRSWTAEGEWSLQRTDADPDVHIRVTTPDTTDRLCAPLRTRGQVSCRNGDDVVLNALRWTQGANAWGDDVAGYREYLVNHELGHYLGRGHVPCPAEGEAAPVMLQQTLGLQGCAPNGWPYP
ncbi:DUF3152 domain-containing protein [Jannaschia sp. R86511]|uniref:DUF3152 domain-containing protein n=1 Tax=Jannaschia sp. R86511 TaxID=3093853 RepID=UPI0036D3BA06